MAGQMATARAGKIGGGEGEQDRWKKWTKECGTDGNGRTPRAGQMATTGHQDRNRWQRHGHQEQDRWQWQDTKCRTDSNGRTPRTGGMATAKVGQMVARK